MGPSRTEAPVIRREKTLRRTIRIGLVSIASATALVLAGSLFASGAAFASQPPSGLGGTTYIGTAMFEDLNNGLCLDGTLSSVFIETCNPNDAHQTFNEYENSEDTSLMLQDVNNGYCLDGTTSSVFVEECNSGDKHQWWSIESGIAYWLLKDVNNNLCLDGNTSSVFIETCNADDLHQNWEPGEFNG